MQAICSILSSFVVISAQCALGPQTQVSMLTGDWLTVCRRKDVFVAVAVDIIRFQSYGLQDNVALLVLLHRKSEYTHMLLTFLAPCVCCQKDRLLVSMLQRQAYMSMT